MVLDEQDTKYCSVVISYLYCFAIINDLSCSSSSLYIYSSGYFLLDLGGGKNGFPSCKHLYLIYNKGETDFTYDQLLYLVHNKLQWFKNEWKWIFTR